MYLRSGIARSAKKRSRSVGARNASTAVTPFQDPSAHLTSKWLNRLRITARTQESREQFSQLQALVEYFNKPSANKGLGEIDWAEWEDKIHTTGVVDKIKAKYDAFMKTEYAVEEAAGRVQTHTPKLDKLEIAVTYNYFLWLSHYVGHINQISTVRQIGDMSEISIYEMLQYSPGFTSVAQAEIEAGNTAPQSHIEDAMFSRIATQFSWGSRYCPPMAHSSDTLNAVVSTLGKLGK